MFRDLHLVINEKVKITWQLMLSYKKCNDLITLYFYNSGVKLDKNDVDLKKHGIR